MCDEKGLYLLEDCAHSYFGETGGRPVGAWEDFAIASPRKFFPISDGGFLILPSGRTRDIVLKSQGFLSPRAKRYLVAEPHFRVQPQFAEDSSEYRDAPVRQRGIFSAGAPSAHGVVGQAVRPFILFTQPDPHARFVGQ